MRESEAELRRTPTDISQFIPPHIVDLGKELSKQYTEWEIEALCVLLKRLKERERKVGGLSYYAL